MLSAERASETIGKPNIELLCTYTKDLTWFLQNSISGRDKPPKNLCQGMLWKRFRLSSFMCGDKQLFLVWTHSILMACNSYNWDPRMRNK